MNWYILDENNKPVKVTSKEAAKFIDSPQRKVKQEEVGEYFISTCFLMLDHNHTMEGAPVLWETMIFKEDSYLEEYCERYTSYEAAVEGHERTKEWLLVHTNGGEE